MALKNSTPHIGARKGQIAKRVIMPGDPKRAQWIAKTFLKNAKLVNDVRGMLAYTGTYKGVRVTAMAHGMGIPSICIYTHELYNFYGVEVIYRVGSCGVGNKCNCKLGDVIIETSGWSDIPIRHWTPVTTDQKNILLPTKSSVNLLNKTAKQLGISVVKKPAFCATFFYSKSNLKDTIRVTGSDVIEMEGFGLFLEAKGAKKKAACLLTVSDNIESGESMTPAARATTFYDMIELALEAIIKEKV